MSVIIETGAEDQSLPRLLYENIFEDGTVTVTSETSDGAGLNAIEDTTFDFWTPSSVGVPAQINVDMGEDVTCDCVGIAAHTAGTNGSEIRIRYSDDDINYTSASVISPLTDDTLMAVFPETTARYWRISVANEICSIGVVKLGKALIMPSGVLSGHIGMNHASRIELLTNRSISGQYLGTRVRMSGAENSINFGQIEASFVDGEMAMFESHFNSGRTFFYAGSPSEYPDDYGYCWRNGGELRPPYDEGGELMQVSMDVAAYVE